MKIKFFSQVAILSVLLFTSLSLVAQNQLESKQSQKVDDISITVESFKKNWWVYKSIGGKVSVRTNKKKRKWWCGWLCKRGRKVEAERITIENTYYTDLRDIPFAIGNHQKICQNTTDCKVKHFAVGVPIKIPSIEPETLGQLLPISGVITHANVTYKGQVYEFRTAKGIYPR